MNRIIYFLNKHFLTIVTILTIFPFCSMAQPVVRDKANNGQYKRMVYKQWNDWQPTPDLHHIFGIGTVPKDPVGWLYWRVTHHPYWSGPDRRPMKVGGPFDKGYASLLLQQEQEKKMRDTVRHMQNIALETYANMAGGEFDLPYSTYFKGKFDDIFGEIDKYKHVLKTSSPKLYQVMSTTPYGKSFDTTLASLKDRIQAVHKSFVDRGARIADYFKIINEAEPFADKFKAYIWFFIQQQLMTNPNTPQKPYKDTNDIPILNSDKQIVNHILQNWQAN